MHSLTPEVMLLVLLAAVVGMVIGVLASMGAFTLRRVQRTVARPPALARVPRAEAVPERPKATRPAAPASLPLVADLLLVDDSAVARAKLRRLFEPVGYRVHLANDGVEALALLQQGRYALMITDLEMPNMDGVTLINTCLAQPRTARMPIVAISGHESLRAKFNECGRVCGVHRKPWVDDILISHVATLVGARQPRAEVLAV